MKEKVKDRLFYISWKISTNLYIAFCYIASHDHKTTGTYVVGIIFTLVVSVIEAKLDELTSKLEDLQNQMES